MLVFALVLMGIILKGQKWWRLGALAQYLICLTGYRNGSVYSIFRPLVLGRRGIIHIFRKESIKDTTGS